MKEKVWIFGDSYSDPNYLEENTFSWPTQLAKNYDVRNFSIRGTGPEWSLNLLLAQIKPIETTDDVNLIFFVSNPIRFDFKFYKDPKDQALFQYVVDRCHSEPGESLVNKYLDRKRFFKEFVKLYIGTMDDFYIDKEMIKYVGSLKLLERKFKKILVWPIFYRLNIDIETSEKFMLINDLPMASVEPNQNFYFGYDSRANHLSKDNHIIMLEQLSAWVDNNSQIDIKKFTRI